MTCPDCGGKLHMVVIYNQPTYGGDFTEMLTITEYECEDCKAQYRMLDEPEEVIF